MKVIAIVTILFATLCALPAVADNNVSIDNNLLSVVQCHQEPITLPVFWENDITIALAQIGLTISATGPGYAWFEDGYFEINESSRGGVLPDVLEWGVRFEGSAGQPDTVLVTAGSYMPPTHNGIPPGPPEPIYNLAINYGPQAGYEYEILIDSVASVPPDDGWLWEDSTGNIDPTFNGDGSSHRIYYQYMPWAGPTFGVIPENDILYGSYCAGAEFSFIIDNLIPMEVELFEVISGPGTITKTGPLTGFYEMPTDTLGTYPVTIRAWSACCFPDFYTDYSFTVILGQPCGDANGDCMVNVSDAVAIINYVFTGGLPPDPLCLGDANGDASVGVSDAVYIINYVFVGGARPVTYCCD